MIRTWIDPDDPVHTRMIRLCSGMTYYFFEYFNSFHRILILGYYSCVLDGENKGEQEEGLAPHRLRQ